jgi:hypothetical protein
MGIGFKIAASIGMILTLSTCGIPNTQISKNQMSGSQAYLSEIKADYAEIRKEINNEIDVQSLVSIYKSRIVVHFEDSSYLKRIAVSISQISEDDTSISGTFTDGTTFYYIRKTYAGDKQKAQDSTYQFLNSLRRYTDTVINFKVNDIKVADRGGNLAIGLYGIPSPLIRE